MEETAVKVENISKDFVLPHEKVNSIKSIFTGLAKGHTPWKAKETQHALKDINFEVKKGEFFGIVGRNGSGKSTLLKIIANIYQPTRGKVRVNGMLVPFIELGVGFNPELTGRENVFLNGSMLGFSKKEVEAMYDDIVAFAELERFMDQKLKNYSSGMQVRLAFSMATRSKADILLIDEVLAVGDADFQRKCYEYFKTLKKEKKTVIFVTHDMGAVQEYCDRAILINNGGITATGKTDKVTAEYLKMFNKPAEETTVAPVDENEDRWGNQNLSIKNIKTSASEDTINFSFLILNNGPLDCSDTILSLDIRNDEQKLVSGNSFPLQINSRPAVFKKGSSSKVSLSIKNNLGGGTFEVDVSLRSSDRITIYDHWNRAAKFKNVIGRDNYFPTIAAGELKIEL